MKLAAPNVTYPINLDSAGNLLANIVIPINSATLVDGSRDLTITESGGGTGTVKLSIPKRSFVLVPTTSRRGSIITVTGAGFPATNPSLSGSITVGIDYGGVTLANIATTSTGTFETTLQVPMGAVIPSTPIR